MSGRARQALAIAEVLTVVAAALAAAVIVATSPLGTWQMRIVPRPFLSYAVMAAVPMAAILLSRRVRSDFGLTVLPVASHLRTVLLCAPAVAAASVAFSFVDYRSARGAAVLVLVQAALLFVIGRLLSSVPSNETSVRAVAVTLPLAVILTPSLLLSGPFFYLLFLGPAEELLFRGYAQSRLNDVFPRRFSFFGTPFGAGALIAAALFGLMHVANLTELAAGRFAPAPWWGLWTFVAGLVFAAVREKSGSIFSPSVLHGFPQAAASMFGFA